MNSKKLLLHICCAPDATLPWPELKLEGYEVTGFFYGDNIHPREEYEKRVEALLSLSDFLGEKPILRSYQPEIWIDETAELKDEPERGKRCMKCFELQLEAAAKYAKENGYKFLSTTLTISPHKDPEYINSVGEKLSQKSGLKWIDTVWRKDNGFKKSVEKSRELGLYRQNYCGCIYSIKNGRAI